MKAEISVKEFIVGLSLLSVSGATFMGKLQQYIPFNSIESEIALACFTASIGLALLFTSIKIKR